MKTMLALAALAGVLPLAPAIAETRTYTAVVQHADLDLRTEQGRSVLDRRLRIAVASTCGEASSADPEGRNEVRACRTDTLRRVAGQRDQIIAAALRNTRVAVAVID